jgi:hypothetical protein
MAEAKPTSAQIVRIRRTQQRQAQLLSRVEEERAAVLPPDVPKSMIGIFLALREGPARPMQIARLAGLSEGAVRQRLRRFLDRPGGSRYVLRGADGVYALKRPGTDVAAKLEAVSRRLVADLIRT